jgi:hypothetical protein
VFILMGPSATKQTPNMDQLLKLIANFIGLCRLNRSGTI